MTETNILNHIRIALSPIVVLFRNSQGMAIFKNKSGKLTYVPYGVGPRNKKTGKNGGSDSIGWTSVVVTPEMVGKKVAVFTAIEIKTLEGDAFDEQVNFVNQVISAGGYGGFASTVDQAKKIVRL